MPPADQLGEEEYVGTARDDEVPGGRDETDAIIRHERVQHADMLRSVSVTIDGVKKLVPRAVAKTDHLGNRLYGPDGLPIPRYTTIYDAAGMPTEVDGTEGAWDAATLNDRIPVLCHRDHLDPVAVCRVCAVHVADKRAGKLMPACKNMVEDNMVVTTRRFLDENGKPTRGAELADKSVRVLLQMLATDHLKPPGPTADRYHNELGDLRGRTGGKVLPLAAPPAEGRNRQLNPRSRPLPTALAKDLPYSARTLQIDHDACILCDRCVRSCTDVRGFKVIGHSGKGYETRIAFDLDKSMDDSSCTQCGECANACPTGAIVYRQRVTTTAWTGTGLPAVDNAGSWHSVVSADFAVPLPTGLLTAEDAQKIELGSGYRPFAEVPLSYLKWNEGSVRRREMAKGDVLCREDEYAATAFLLEEGEFAITTRENPTPFKVDASDLILGEMACLTAQPRTSTITVASGRGLVYEITRNLLDMTRRTRRGRDVLGPIYRRRVPFVGIGDSELYGRLKPATQQAFRKLAGVAKVLTRERGGVVLAEGDKAEAFYIVRLGFVEITVSVDGKPWPAVVLGPGKHFGELGLLSNDPAVREKLTPDQRGRRTATVTALDDVELVSIDRQSFLGFLKEFPEAKKLLVEQCLRTLTATRAAPTPTHLRQQSEYARLGLYQAQSLLVLDLERCTRCDECTRGCADSHASKDRTKYNQPGLARLLREGARFDKYLVTTCCRSCHKPYCLEGCPVDAIHRKGTGLEIKIDNHCIGCSLCEKQCPYGAIQMTRLTSDETSERTAAVQQKAVNCDLCDGLDTPYCVRSCPHDAAFRFTGENLLAQVRKGKP